MSFTGIEMVGGDWTLPRNSSEQGAEYGKQRPEDGAEKDHETTDHETMGPKEKS
jgi:hypothetical protein